MPYCHIACTIEPGFEQGNKGSFVYLFYGFINASEMHHCTHITAHMLTQLVPVGQPCDTIMPDDILFS